MKTRNGFTLMELVVTMTVGSTLMVVAIGLIHQTLSLSTAARQRNDHMRSLSRLGRQFRIDVHRATACTVTVNRMQLEMPDSSVVTFQADSNRVTRIQPTGDGRTLKSLYILLPDSSTQFSALDNPNRTVVTVARRTITLPKRGAIDRRIEAVVGRLSIHEHAGVAQ